MENLSSLDVLASAVDFHRSRRKTVGPWPIGCRLWPALPSSALQQCHVSTSAGSIHREFPALWVLGGEHGWLLAKLGCCCWLHRFTMAYPLHGSGTSPNQYLNGNMIYESRFFLNGFSLAMFDEGRRNPKSISIALPAGDEYRQVRLAMSCWTRCKTAILAGLPMLAIHLFIYLYYLCIYDGISL